MGDVIEAEHIALRRVVVVKLIRDELAASPGMRDRFRLEAQVAASLDGHPNIVKIHDFGQTPAGLPYLAMEKLEGVTLRQEVQSRGPLPVAEAIALVLQVLAGLTAAHAAGIIHRDIKPENLFLCDPVSGGERVLKILDFGIAKLTATAGQRRGPAPLALPTTDGLALGTPRFIAPEQALGQAVDSRADIYAVGAVLYWLLTGRDPFHHHTAMFAVLHAQVKEAPRRPSECASQPIPAALDQVILKTLEKRPSMRHGSAAELGAELRRVLTASPSKTRWSHTEPLDSRAFQPVVERPTLELPINWKETVPRPEGSGQNVGAADRSLSVAVPIGRGYSVAQSGAVVQRRFRVVAAVLAVLFSVAALFALVWRALARVG